MWGEQSCQWDFSRGARLAQVSLDYPFEGWHELVNCYRNTGWQITSREVRSAEKPSRDWPLIVVVMQDELNVHGIVCWSQFDQDGNPMLPARDQLAAGVVDRWKRSTGRLGTYQVQTFSSSLTPPDNEDLEELVRLHCQTRDDLVRGVASATRGEIRVRLQEYDTATTDLETALTSLPRRAELHSLLAECYDELGPTSLADMHREKAKQMDSRPDEN